MSQIVNRERVVNLGEVYTAEKEVKAMLALIPKATALRPPPHNLNPHVVPEIS